MRKRSEVTNSGSFDKMIRRNAYGDLSDSARDRQRDRRVISQGFALAVCVKDSEDQVAVSTRWIHRAEFLARVLMMSRLSGRCRFFTIALSATTLRFAQRNIVR